MNGSIGRTLTKLGIPHRFVRSGDPDLEDDQYELSGQYDGLSIQIDGDGSGYAIVREHGDGSFSFIDSTGDLKRDLERAAAANESKAAKIARKLLDS